MLLNEIAETLAPLDLTRSGEYASLVESAAELGVSHEPTVRWLSGHTVVRWSRFHFLEWGEPGAPTVLLLHGMNQSAHSWDLVSLSLAGRYHVLALDQRGHGDSEWSRDLDYSEQARAADALAFLADRELTSAVVIGHSMGGRVALRMALERPEAVPGLVVVDTGPRLNAQGVQVIRNFVQRNTEFDDPGQFIDRVANHDQFRSREHISRTIKYNLIRRVDGKYVSKADHRRVDGTAGQRTGTDEIRAVKRPVLVVRGSASEVFDAHAAAEFVTALPDGRLVTVPDANHNVPSSNTVGFLDAVRPFLADLGWGGKQ
jgi:esterase